MAVLRKVDAVTVRVPDLDDGLRFYRDVLGHRLEWRNDAIGQVGLAVPDSDAEIVLTTRFETEPNWLVESVDTAVDVFRAHGGGIVVEASDIPVGRVAVVTDPFGNRLVLVDLSKGVYVSDADGVVTGVDQGNDRAVPFDRQPMLAGELLELRPLRPADFEALYAIASDPLLWEQHPSKDRTQRLVFEQWFADAVASGGALVAIDRTDERVIGTSRFEHYDAVRREVEIGWTFLDRSHWGGPYNREMKRLMLDHAFGEVDAVVFRIHSDNQRSQRAVEKLGAVCVGTEIDQQGRGENLVFRLSRADLDR